MAAILSPALSISCLKVAASLSSPSLTFQLTASVILPRKSLVAVSPRVWTARASAAQGDSAGAANVSVSGKPNELLQSLKLAAEEKNSEAVRAALDSLKEASFAKSWSSSDNLARRQVNLNELSRAGIINAETLAVPSVRNDARFLITVVGSTSVVAVAAGFLPGDWGFFVPYLVGGISLAVLAVGSVAPGLFEAAIGVFSKTFPDYQERLLRHEAAHFLTAYLVGLPVVAYSLDIGKEHLNLTDQRLQKKIYDGTFNAKDLDRLAVVAMAGLAAEGLKYEKVVGQSADLFSLQRLFNRSKPPLSNQQQQNLTRWAVLYACNLIKNNDVAFEALMKKMEAGAPIEECIEAIESQSA